ncbi:MAG: HEAT repeat domain-containing protein [Thermotogaceae bacterium]|nr:HEAT repeat domain-containing protein [Thermotogaceae bacterium]
MALEKYKKLIERIVEQKGVDAIPKLIELLEDEQREVREIALESIYALGDKARKPLLEIFRSRLKERRKKDILLLYLIDVLSNFGERSIKQHLYEIMDRYNTEQELLVIYEALAKLGDGEKFVDILGYFLTEDDYKEELADQAVMALAHISNDSSLRYLVKGYKDPQLGRETKENIIQAIAMIIVKEPQLYRFLSDEEEIVKKLKEFTSPAHQS